jgi:hypothetical protein
MVSRRQENSCTTSTALYFKNRMAWFLVIATRPEAVSQTPPSLVGLGFGAGIFFGVIAITCSVAERATSFVMRSSQTARLSSASTTLHSSVDRGCENACCHNTHAPSASAVVTEASMHSAAITDKYWDRDAGRDRYAREYVPRSELPRVRRWIRRARAETAFGWGQAGFLRRLTASV